MPSWGGAPASGGLGGGLPGVGGLGGGGLGGPATTLGGAPAGLGGGGLGGQAGLGGGALGGGMLGGGALGGGSLGGAPPVNGGALGGGPGGQLGGAPGGWGASAPPAGGPAWGAGQQGVPSAITNSGGGGWLGGGDAPPPPPSLPANAPWLQGSNGAASTGSSLEGSELGTHGSADPAPLEFGEHTQAVDLGVAWKDTRPSSYKMMVATITGFALLAGCGVYFLHRSTIKLQQSLASKTNVTAPANPSDSGAEQFYKNARKEANAKNWASALEDSESAYILLKDSKSFKSKLPGLKKLRRSAADHVSSKQLADAENYLRGRAYNQAIDSGKEAASTIESKGGDSKKKARAYAIVARSYKGAGELDQAATYFHKAIAAGGSYSGELYQVRVAAAPQPQVQEVPEQAPAEVQPDIGEGENSVPGGHRGRGGHQSAQPQAGPAPAAAPRRREAPPFIPSHHADGGLRLGNSNSVNGS
jgi:hypothetical protein